MHFAKLQLFCGVEPDIAGGIIQCRPQEGSQDAGTENVEVYHGEGIPQIFLLL